ncbi:MAG: sugar phosphate isomerase/epimerase [Verrucomicrobia bacterium]|nr:sugar phosphate isomerase/epimerase [Verrucomicrobiota bacterium]
MQIHISRRLAISHTARATAAVCLAPSLAPLFAAPDKRRFKIGACDWSLGKQNDPGALDVAKIIGLDGVQVSLGTVANDLHLRHADVQQQYRDATKKSGVEVASLAIGEMNSVPYKSDPRTIQWVSDCVDVMRAMGTRVVLLAFFGKGDLKGDKPGTDEVVRRLRDVAPKAEKAGVILGIESWLNAEEHVDILHRVGSPAVKVYYDVANSEKMGYEIYREIRWLGKQGLICEFHMKENGALLGAGRVDFKKVREAIDDIGYSGWMQIEGAMPAGGKIEESYIQNRQFLRGIFPTDA